MPVMPCHCCNGFGYHIKAISGMGERDAKESIVQCYNCNGEGFVRMRLWKKTRITNTKV